MLRVFLHTAASNREYRHSDKFHGNRGKGKHRSLGNPLQPGREEAIRDKGKKRNGRDNNAYREKETLTWCPEK